MARIFALYPKLFAVPFFAVLLASCGGEGSGSRPASKAFARKIYATIDRAEEIRIISGTEIERSNRLGNFVGTYTREGNKIRAVFEVLGTRHSHYFVETEDGLTAQETGMTYLTEAALKKNTEAMVKTNETKKVDEDRQASLPQAAVPAPLTTRADGALIFRADFEDKSAPNFEIDPLIGMAGHNLTVRADRTGTNQVLRLAQVRHKNSACMARLLLPKDCKLSRNSTLSFIANFAQGYADPNPEVRVVLERMEGTTRVVSTWIRKDPAFKTTWPKVEVQLHTPDKKVPSLFPLEANPTLSIFAGKPDETVECFIDDVVLIDYGEATRK